jgi:hypothetical protein
VPQGGHARDEVAATKTQFCQRDCAIVRGYPRRCRLLGQVRDERLPDVDGSGAPSPLRKTQLTHYINAGERRNGLGLRLASDGACGEAAVTAMDDDDDGDGARGRGTAVQLGSENLIPAIFRSPVPALLPHVELREIAESLFCT